MDSKQLERFGTIPRLVLPARYVDGQRSQDERITQVEFAVPHQPSSHFSMDSFVIYDQTTWMLPAIGGVSGISRLKAQESGKSYISFIRNLVKNSGIYALSSLAVPFV